MEVIESSASPGRCTGSDADLAWPQPDSRLPQRRGLMATAIGQQLLSDRTHSGVAAHRLNNCDGNTSVMHQRRFASRCSWLT